MRPVWLTTICCAALLGACATGYAPESVGNIGGYSESKRGPGVWQVWFVSHGHILYDKNDDFALLRGAELCLAEDKPFMRTSKFDTREEIAGRAVHLQSSLEVTCLGEKSGDAQEAAAVAADIRKRYRIAAPRSAS